MLREIRKPGVAGPLVDGVPHAGTFVVRDTDTGEVLGVNGAWVWSKVTDEDVAHYRTEEMAHGVCIGYGQGVLDAQREVKGKLEEFFEEER